VCPQHLVEACFDIDYIRGYDVMRILKKATGRNYNGAYCNTFNKITLFFFLK